MSHINKIGVTRSQTLSNLAVELWNYALNRNLIISAIHIPGKLNVLADHKSRIFKDSIEWMLKPNIFMGEVARLVRPDIDLFASRVNHQIPEFVSWRPEPNAMAIDAFNLTWNYHLSYLFLPFSLIPLCLKKYREIKQNAFSLHQSGKADLGIQFFCQCCHTSLYCYLPICSSTPRNERGSHLLEPKVFQTSCMENFRQRLQGQGFPQEVSDILLSSWRKTLQGNMRVLGGRGVAGVTLGGLIAFRHLSNTS